MFAYNLQFTRSLISQAFIIIIIIIIIFTLYLGFSNCGARTTIGTPTIDYW